MTSRYTIELEPEVRDWLKQLGDADYAKAERFADRLADEGPALPFPLSSHLGGPVFELRIGSHRVTYWLASDHRAVLLTVFPKTRQRESKEVARALQAQKTCEAGHPPAGEHDVYER